MKIWVNSTFVLPALLLQV